MSPPRSVFFQVEDIPNAGRGVIARQPIPRGTEVLVSGPSAAHVTFRQYRKEVCARCFHYDLGRTLPVRHTSTGKVSCSTECMEQWLEDEGELGLKAWESLHAFVQARTKNAGNSYECLPDRGEKPTRIEIEGAWREAEEQRTGSTQGKKANRSHAHAAIDPDVLGYLLSSALSYNRDPGKWQNEVLELALDDEPYRSTHDLSTHTTSYQQLTTFLPQALLTSCTPTICHQAVAAASHNSFGIRSADGEEYMGYALYPDASYFNHSCSPNIAKARVGREWTFTAERDIGVGEECCITYLGGDEKDMVARERRERLREHWAFECMCVRCREESELIAS